MAAQQAPTPSIKAEDTSSYPSCPHQAGLTVYECTICLEETVASAKASVPNLLRQTGWNNDELSALSAQHPQFGEDISVAAIAPKPSTSWKDMDYEVQLNLLREMNRLMEEAKAIRPSLKRPDYESQLNMLREMNRLRMEAEAGRPRSKRVDAQEET